MVCDTHIRISTKNKRKLEERKIRKRDSYDNIIEDVFDEIDKLKFEINKK